MSNSIRKSSLGRILDLIRPGAWIYLVAAILRSLILGFSFNLVLAFINKDVMNAAITGNQALLSSALTLAAATFFSGVPLLMGSGYVLALYEKRASTTARVRVFSHIVDLPISRVTQKHSSDLVSRSTNDLQTLGDIYVNLVPNLLFGITLGLVGILSIFAMNWQMGVFALILGILTTIASIVMARPLRAKSNTIQESLSRLTQGVTDVVQGLKVTKMFQGEDKANAFFVQTNQKAAAASIDHARTQALYEAVNTFLEWMRSVGALVFGLYLLANGEFELGGIFAAIYLQGYASFMFKNLGGFITNIQRSLAGSARVFELLDWPNEEAERSQVKSKSLAARSVDPAIIHITDLDFSYEANDAPNSTDSQQIQLQQVSLSVQKGQFAALVGPSGSGKSTLLKLLMGFFPLQHGAITINGRPLNDYALEDLRDLIAYVPQDAYLFDATIAENIAYGKTGATSAEVKAAAEAVDLHDFIQSLPSQYETKIGERGARLSGGQRQRIGIARALIKDAPILLLDEATSALDSESEIAVQKALDRLMQDRTTIAIAHRLSTIKHADVIYVFHSGKVVEQGTHTSLINQNGLYSQLVAHQA